MSSSVQKEKFLLNIATVPGVERKFINTDYFANVCHEIRTPLGAIVGLSAILARPDITHQRQTECATMLQDSSHMLMELINDLLDSFKIDHAKMELEYVAFDLAKVLKEAKSIATAKAQEKGLSIQMQLSETIRTLYMGDPLRIRQILLNLLGNAVKFTSEGVISIYVNEVKGSKGNSEISITVADCGIGMDEEILEKIFDKYTQGDTTISRHYGGTGLGLFISQELAHLMKGNITVKSWPNMGSQFVLTLPLQKSPILSVVT